VVVRGGGELGSAAARLLHLAGYRVVVLEQPAPLAVRRLVAFAEAVFVGRAEVEGVAAALVPASDLGEGLPEGVIPVAVDAEGGSLERLRPDALLDARMAKAPLDTRRDQARVVIGLGPGFQAGRDVHAVVETHRGPDLGRVIWEGAAAGDTSEPAPVLGHTHDRVLRAPCGGVFRGRVRLGERVEAGTRVGDVEGRPVIAVVGGSVRGLVADGVRVDEGVKLGDVDPRSVPADRISDKARAVAAGVLEAVAMGLGPGRLPRRRGSSIFIAD
jgi:xanthine dehydrogenase accessory factor